MDILFRNNPNVIVYLDDVAIKGGDTESEHWKLVREVLEEFHKADFKVNLGKCAFAKTEFEYLGFIVNGKEYKPTEEYLDILDKVPAPSSKEGLSSYMGMLAWMSDFIHVDDDYEALRTLLKKA